jgi:hypothetical protein
MKMAYLDLFYRINGDLHHNIKEILPLKRLVKEIHLIDDLSAFEMYEIARMPVIQLANESPQKPKQPLMRLTVFCCSCIGGCIFLNLFTGDNWQFYIVNL